MTPARSGVQRSGFLRPEPSRFLGRSVELELLSAPVMTSQLVSIVGPAGIGKTRLALRYATTREQQYRSVWFCDVSDARDVEEMTAIALRTFVSQDGAAASAALAATAVGRALAARPGALVILDNLEHLLPEASAAVQGWLAAAPSVRFVVTSRVPLHIEGEQIIELGAMPLPAPGSASGDAVELFVDRVRARDMSYAPLDEELSSIAEIVRHLRGVPLAIELAAARVGAEHPRDVLSRVLPRSAPPPPGEPISKTARRAIDRAFGLLGPAEHATLCQCSVFRGSFTLQAASRVVRIDGAELVSDVVLGLAQKNLLQVARYQPLRFAMCEGMRALAAEALELSPHATATQWRHAEYYCERADAIAGSDTHPADAADDWDDLQAAMALGASAKRPQVVLRTALAIDALALGNGLGGAQLGYLDEALRHGAAGELGLLARALGVRANALYALGRLVEARRDAETSLKLSTEVGDQRQMGAMLRAAAESAFQLGDFDAARKHLSAAVTLEQERGDLAAIAAVHCQLGSLHQSLDETERARGEFLRSLDLALYAKDGAAEARAIMGLAWNHFERGDRDDAREHFERALVLLKRLKMARSERITVGYLGVLYFDAGLLDLACDHLRRSALASRQAGDFRVEGIFEGVRGAVLAAQDRVEESRASFDLASRLLAGNAFYAGSIAVYRGHLDLARAREAATFGDDLAASIHLAAARRRIDAARSRNEGEPSALVLRSDDARMAVRILERALALGLTPPGAEPACGSS